MSVTLMILSTYKPLVIIQSISHLFIGENEPELRDGLEQLGGRHLAIVVPVQELELGPKGLFVRHCWPEDNW